MEESRLFVPSCAKIARNTHEFISCDEAKCVRHYGPRINKEQRSTFVNYYLLYHYMRNNPLICIFHTRIEYITELFVNAHRI